MRLLIISSILALPNSALGWGAVAQQAAAYVAQSFLKPETVSKCQSILGDGSNSYLANAATWANEYAQTAAGAWAGPLRYVAANDNPPLHCDVLWERDCPDACILTAFANVTGTLVYDTASHGEKIMALRFLVDYVISITQPLQNESLDKRGTLLQVNWNGTQTDLHYVWANAMPQTMASGNSLEKASVWATALIKDINTGVYDQMTHWLRNLSLCWISDPAYEWSVDANSLVCTAVIPDGINVVQSQDLSKAYYRNSIPIINMQIAKAGYRLAAWLNLVFTGEPGLAVPMFTSIDMCNTTRLTHPGATAPT